jgi:hypothetical protein
VPNVNIFLNNSFEPIARTNATGHFNSANTLAGGVGGFSVTGLVTEHLGNANPAIRQTLRTGRGDEVEIFVEGSGQTIANISITGAFNDSFGTIGGTLVTPRQVPILQGGDGHRLVNEHTAYIHNLINRINPTANNSPSNISRNNWNTAVSGLTRQAENAFHFTQVTTGDNLPFEQVLLVDDRRAGERPTYYSIIRHIPTNYNLSPALGVTQGRLDDLLRNLTNNHGFTFVREGSIWRGNNFASPSGGRYTILEARLFPETSQVVIAIREAELMPVTSDVEIWLFVVGDPNNTTRRHNEGHTIMQSDLHNGGTRVGNTNTINRHQRTYTAEREWLQLQTQSDFRIPAPTQEWIDDEANKWHIENQLVPRNFLVYAQGGNRRFNEETRNIDSFGNFEIRDLSLDGRQYIIKIRSGVYQNMDFDTGMINSARAPIRFSQDRSYVYTGQIVLTRRPMHWSQEASEEREGLSSALEGIRIRLGANRRDLTVENSLAESPERYRNAHGIPITINHPNTLDLKGMPQFRPWADTLTGIKQGEHYLMGRELSYIELWLNLMY